MENLLIVLSGPSGVGKGTIKEKLLQKCKMVESISATTRKMREGEVHRKSYFFLGEEEFLKLDSEDKFLEHCIVFGNHYGTMKDFVEENLKSSDVLVEIDVQGGLKVKEKKKEAILIFILPPTLSDLKSRLVGRNTETAAEIEKRYAKCRDEILAGNHYDYVVVNHSIEQAAREIVEIINSEKRKSFRNKDEIQQILNT